MEFRVLGPFHVVVDGRARELPATAELAVLALLVLNAGRVVTAETLIDALWPENPPANPGNALQGRVSKLRRALSAAGLPEAFVVTRRPGYLVEIDPEQVDAHRFVRLLGEARRMAERNPGAASRLYQEALALWRGSALPEFTDQAWARAEATRLEEMRLAATEERFDLELAAGRHTEVVAELEALVAAHPLRERLHGQLMLALYRSGRQANALAAYQRTRTVLDTELGLDPSVELRQLEQAILRQDPKLAAPAQEPTAVSPPLPGRLTSFIGRSRELDQVAELIAEHRLVTLTGPGGVGKTSVAFEVARAADGYPDGVWLVRLASVPDGDRLAGAVADALGVRHDGSVLPADDQLLRHLRDGVALLVLDNCEHLADACATLVERLLAFCPGLRLLTTSREPLGCAGEVQYVIVPLDIPPPGAAPTEVSAYDAVRLFVDRARTALPDFRLDEASAEHVMRICQQLDGIPLAIELAAVRVKTLPVADLASRLHDRFGL
ncbi:MAG TPA: BTAD domain-containing putative transcriptional regulator, partial [Pilimelia sp.]|nr:BTAD domain-containing putative transcriptional regulator [Pilimelia sp.]